MRNLIALLLLVIATAGVGQSYEQLMQARMQQQGITMEPNNDPYEPLGFRGSFRMEVEMFKDGQAQGERSLNARYAFKDDMVVVEMMMAERPGGMRMLYDLRGKWNYILQNEGAKRTAMKMRMMKMTKTDATPPQEKTTFERTDAIRTIEGRSCRKYNGATSNGTWEAWVAEEVKFNMAKAMRQISGDKAFDQWQGIEGIGGLTMEMTWNTKETGEKMIVHIHDLTSGSVDEALFSLDGYSVMEMPSLPR
ncbi:MAG: DUF4412 domain-containing protein [Flavobacteriales bacterium]|nr:DUF4412 domain-containing protein [Flavobacteriales bacterium]